MGSGGYLNSGNPEIPYLCPWSKISPTLTPALGIQPLIPIPRTVRYILFARGSMGASTPVFLSRIPESGRSGVTAKKGVSFICPYGYPTGPEICHSIAYISVLQRCVKCSVCLKSG